MNPSILLLDLQGKLFGDESMKLTGNLRIDLKLVVELVVFDLRQS